MKIAPVIAYAATPIRLPTPKSYINTCGLSVVTISRVKDCQYRKVPSVTQSSERVSRTATATTKEGCETHCTRTAHLEVMQVFSRVDSVKCRVHRKWADLCCQHCTALRAVTFVCGWVPGLLPSTSIAGIVPIATVDHCSTAYLGIHSSCAERINHLG
jgi:hypothetical protein